MIELELKYRLENTAFTQAIEKYDAVCKEQCDSYFDTPNGLMYCGGNFLRIRDNSRIDFKLFVGDTTHNFCEETRYALEDFTDKNKKLCALLKTLGFDLDGIAFSSFEQFCSACKLTEIATIKKHRRAFQIGGVEFSIDEVDSLGFFLEIEYNFPDTKFDLTQNRQWLISKAIDAGILDLACDTPVTIGYVELYLKKHNMELYKKGKYQD